MERIWNKSELEQMDEWSVFNNGNWYTDGRGVLLIGMLGKPVQWCKDQGYTVTGEMIAKTEFTHPHLFGKYVQLDDRFESVHIWSEEKDRKNKGKFTPLEISKEKYLEEMKHTWNKETELVQEAVTQANDKLKDRLDKGEIGITLLNGTTLKVGDKVRLEEWNIHCIEILYIGKYRMFTTDVNGGEDVHIIRRNWLPYTEPKEEPKPLEETWTKTMDLRLAEKPENWSGFHTSLQQKQISNLGNEKWVDIETVTI